MSATPTETKPNWPYTSFKSLLNVLDRFRAAGGTPPQIDRSVLGGSEGQKTQIIAAMKFFGLLGGDGKTVTPLLTQLVADEKERPRIVRDLLAKHYPEATRLAQVNGTTKQLEDTFSGISGDTLRKAVSFYLHAAKFSKHPVSRHFKAPHGVGTSRPRRSRNSRQSVDESPAPTPSVSSIEAAKARYLDLLLNKAKESSDGGLDTGLLDRIERLLGYDSPEQSDPGEPEE